MDQFLSFFYATRPVHVIYEWFLSKTATESSKNIEHFRKNIVYDGSYVDVVSNKENVHTHKYTSSIEKVHKKDIDSHTDLIRIQNTKNYGKYRNIICKITIEYSKCILNLILKGGVVSRRIFKQILSTELRIANKEKSPSPSFLYKVLL